jgi:type I restriction enzyme R subunit
MIAINSVNFGFLQADSPQLVRLGALAEHYFQDDPNTWLIKLRQFGELLAQTTAASAGLFASPEEPQADLWRRPDREAAVWCLATRLPPWSSSACTAK